GTHVLIAGATGSGKGSWLWSVVRGLLPAACEDGPRQLDLQVARYVRDERERLAEEGTAVLNLLAEERGPKDPWDEGGLERFEPGATRYDFSDSVKVSATLPRFSMQFHDWAHMVNHWPYGQWQVDFAWDRVVGVRVGFRDYFMDMMPEP
ncbi:hypothetical protein ACWCSH_32800, partial [Streptosporangium sp. NPDC001682]